MPWLSWDQSKTDCSATGPRSPSRERWTASLGRGCIFSALPVAVFQGTITLFAGALSPIMTAAALDSLSLVGSMLIFCVGVNLIRPQTFRTANMLPSVVIAVIYALLF